MERKLLFGLLAIIVAIAASVVTQDLLTQSVARFEDQSTPFELPIGIERTTERLVDRLEHAYGVVNVNFYKPERVSENELLAIGVRGMIEYARNPEEFEPAKIERISWRGQPDEIAAVTPNEGDMPAIDVEIDESLIDLDIDTLEGILDGLYTNIVNSDLNNESEMLSDTEILNAGIRTMIAALEDPYSRYNTIQEFDSFTDNLNGEYEGIGAYIDTQDGYVSIISPIKGGPAESSGIRAGDVVLTIDGESTQGYSTNEASSRLRGDKGTDVVVEIRHKTGQLETITITRDRIYIPSVEYAFVEPEIGMVSINRFGLTTADEVRDALKDIDREQPELEGLILDLRMNGGGYFHIAQEIASLFVDRGNLLVIQQERDDRMEHWSRGNNRENIPVAILINEGTASASEILAGALRDHEMGILVGQRSFGKGVIQTPLRLRDNSRLILTTAEYLTPDEHQVQDVGLAPTDGYEVESWFQPFFEIEDSLAKSAIQLHEHAEQAVLESGQEMLDENQVLSASLEVINHIGEKLNEIVRHGLDDEYEEALVDRADLISMLNSDPVQLLIDTEIATYTGEVEVFIQVFSELNAGVESNLAELEDRFINNEIKAALQWLRSPEVSGKLCPCEIPTASVSQENQDSY